MKEREAREMCNKTVEALFKRAEAKHSVPGSRLQLFAGDGSGDDGGDHDDGGSGDDPNDGDDGSGDDPGNGDNKRLSFDDFLGQEGNQSEFDKRVQAAVDAAVIRAQEEWKSAADDRVSEAEKLAKMTKEEREKYLQQKERREFEAERAAFEREKLLVEIRKELQEQTLPLVFADPLVTISDAKKIKEAIAEIKKVWDAGITEAIKAKARQTTPPEGGQFIGSRRGLSSIRKMANENRIIKN